MIGLAIRKAGMLYRLPHWLLLCALCGGFQSAAFSQLPPPSVGLNKFDLAQQYLGKSSGGDGSPEWMRLERAMAAKAIADAHQLGVKFFRVSITGYAPATHGATGDLDLWIKDPDRYWTVMDTMMADLRRSDIRLVATLMFSSVQFPAMTGETTGDLFRRPSSRSWQLLAKYVTEFVTRYRGNGIIMFYEMANELNLSADIDLLSYCKVKQKLEACAVMTNFTTDELDAFSARFTGLIKSLDPSALVTSGYAVPRAAAEHLRRHPATAGKVDWTQDSPEELAANLALIHKSFDIISVHLYPSEENGRFNSATPVDVLSVIKRTADKIGKPLFIGEFGDLAIRTAGPGSFVDRTLDEVVQLHVPYSALWVWEFYQRKPYLTYDNPATMSNLEPGYTDRILAHLVATNKKLGVSSPLTAARDITPPRVIITWPVDCRPYNVDVPIQASASAATGAIAKVEFWVDDRKVGTVVTLPYTMSLKRDEPAQGDHHLAVKAYDTSGNMSEYHTLLRMGGAAARGNCPFW